MTKEQESIAEKVIQLHKDNNGIYDWVDFVAFFKTTHDDRVVIARALREKDIIGDHSTGTRLKEFGWSFSGFETDRQTSAKLKMLTTEKLEYEVKNAKRIFKTYWWTFGISLLAFLLALGKIIYDIIKAK